jgi:hypothetical protein
VLFLRAAGDKIAFLREYFDPVRAAKALDTPILGLESWLSNCEDPGRPRSLSNGYFRGTPSIKNSLRRQSEDHHFGSLIMLAVMAVAFLLVVWVATKALFFFLQESPIPWKPIGKACPCVGYLVELGMFDDAAVVLEEIAPEDKTRNEVLGMAAKKRDMAAAVASHLIKLDPETADWWISLAYSVRRRPFCCGRKRYIPRLPSPVMRASRAHGGGERARWVSTENRSVFALIITASSFLLPAPRPFRKLEVTDDCMIEKEYEALHEALEAAHKILPGAKECDAKDSELRKKVRKLEKAVRKRQGKVARAEGRKNK